MAMQMLRARQRPDGYHFRIHLDTTKLIDGNPDPEWVAEYVWGLTPPQGVTVAAYRATVVAEAKALAALELAKRVPPAGTALADEGGTF